MLGLMLRSLFGVSGFDKRSMLDRMLEEHDRTLLALQGLVPAGSGSDARRSFTSTIPVEQHSMASLSPRQRLRAGPIMLRLVREMSRSRRTYTHPVVPESREASPELLARVEAVAAEHGATAVRYVLVPDDCIFAGKAIPYRNAIVFTVKMDERALDTAPSFEAFLEVARGYHRMAVIGNRIAAMLRAEGHAAHPGTALGGVTDYSRLGELAGLGAIGYHGVLITPGEGAMLRLSTVYTSIENLPVRPPAPTGWIRDFCAKCRKCVRECPPGAIHERPVLKPNGRVQCIDTTACLDYFSANYGCGVCIDVCPFTQTGFDVIAARFKGNPKAPRYEIRPLPPEPSLASAPAQTPPTGGR